MAPNDCCLLVFTPLCSPLYTARGLLLDSIWQIYEYVTSEIMFLKECGFGLEITLSWIICSGGRQVPFHEALLWKVPCGEELSFAPNSQWKTAYKKMWQGLDADPLALVQPWNEWSTAWTLNDNHMRYLSPKLHS